MQECSRRPISPALPILLLGLPLVGCQTFTEKGMALGGLLGAGTGAIIGSQTGNAGAGAAIGAALGGIGGGLVGAGMDETEERNKARIAAATAPPPTPQLSVADVVQMAHSGVSDEVIVSSIRNSGSVYNLNSSDIVALHNQGVSDRVLQVMLDSSRRAPVPQQTVIYRSATPVYMVEPAPVGIGIHCGPRHHCW